MSNNRHLPIDYLPDHLEYNLAFHCAPAIAGIKAANLVSLNKARLSNWPASFRGSAAGLCAQGLRFFKLAECDRRILLLTYRPRLLAAQLDRPEHRAFLTRCGYRPGWGLHRMLSRLRARIRSDGDYPHEIGLFLGYPLADVEGFIAHRGDGCKLCGYWKVYGDPELARRLFAAYDSARDFYCRQVLCGERIHNIAAGSELYSQLNLQPGGLYL